MARHILVLFAAVLGQRASISLAAAEGSPQQGTLPLRLAQIAYVQGCFGNVAGGGQPSLEPLLECLFRQWYPGADSEEYQEARFADSSARGQGLGKAGPVNEAPVEAVKTLLASLQEHGEALGESDAIAVLGSGLGRLALQAALTTSVLKVVGIEIGQRRHRLAEEARRLALGVGRTMLGIGSDGKLYSQVLELLAPSSPWTLASHGSFDALAVGGPWVYAVGREDHHTYRQRLSQLSVSSSWELLSRGRVADLAVDGEMMYGVGLDRRVWRQNLSSLPHSSTNLSMWQPCSMPPAFSIAIEDGIIYSVREGGTVWKQTIAEMNVSTPWQLAAKGPVEAISAYAGRLYGVAQNLQVFVQEISSMTNVSDWFQTAQGSVLSVAFAARSVEALLQKAPPDRPGWPLRNDMLEFVHGDMVDEALVKRWKDATLLILPSLSFEVADMLRLGWLFARELQPGTIIYTQRRLPGCYSRLLQIGKLQLPMAWAPEGISFYSYLVLGASATPAPAWLVSNRVGASDLMASLVAHEEESQTALSFISRQEWLRVMQAAAGNVALKKVPTWRLAVAAAGALGLSVDLARGSLLRSEVHAVIDLLYGASASACRQAIRCAASAFKARLNVSVPTSADAAFLEAVSTEALQQRFQDVHLRDDQGRTLLWWMAGDHEDANAQLITWLLQAGAAAEVVDVTGISALGRASAAGHLAAATILMEHGANALSGAGPDVLPSKIAAAGGHADLANILRV